MSSILEQSYCPTINGGTFNTITNNHPTINGQIFNAITNTTNTTYHATRAAITGMERLMEAVSPNAFYDSDNRADPPKCHENTRVAVISKIMDWVTNKINTDALMIWLCSPAATPEAYASMLWLYGPAGAGKTAIARRVAELCEAQGLLLASFLFFRSDPKRNTIKPLVANVAYCIARVIPSTYELIKSAIEADPLIFTYSVEVQLTKLVLEPFRLLADQGYFFSGQFPRLVVIDGLDECLDNSAQTNLIQLLASAVARNHLPLKFLIVSRPEAHLKLAITRASEKTTLSHLELNNDFLPDEDIRRFLTDKFHEIKMCHPFGSGIPSIWPSEDQMDHLIHKASGQFIYASLVVRFVESACESPMRQLDIILGIRPPINHDLPFAELDALYTFILSCTKNVDIVLQILGVHGVLHHSRTNFKTSLETIESLLYLEDGDALVYLSSLNSLLKISSEAAGEHYIDFHHTSFTDFLDNPERSKDYCINAPQCHSHIAKWILKAFTSNGSRYRIDQLEWLTDTDPVQHLEHTIWTFELKHDLSMFSISTYLNWFDSQSEVEESEVAIDPYNNYPYNNFPDKFLHYLEQKGESDLYHHHLLCYLEHVNSSINNPPIREKLRLMSTVWFVLQEPITTLWRGIEAASWQKLCAKLFGFNEAEIKYDLDEDAGYQLLRDPTTYIDRKKKYLDSDASLHYFTLHQTMYGVYGPLDGTNSLIPKPILSYRLARIAISCMRYLHRPDPQNSPIQGNTLAAWATKSKKLPWLWRQRIRVTSIGRQQPNWNSDLPRYLFSQSLRRSHQKLYSEGIQSEKFYKERQIFYIWTLDLLYHTLCAAMKSDELTKVLSKPIIPSVAYILFPMESKRVEEAVGAYLEKFSPSSLDAPGMKRIVRFRTEYRPQRNAVRHSTSSGSKQISFADREQHLKRNIDKMLALVYARPTRASPKTIASLNALLNGIEDWDESSEHDDS